MEQAGNAGEILSSFPAAWVTSSPLPVTTGGPDHHYVPVSTAAGAGGGIRWLERSAARFPDRVAVADDRLALRYSDLLDRIYGLAGRIAEAVPPGGAVASLLHNGPAAAVAILAALCSGRTILPIDAGHPAERQAALLAAAGAGAVILAADGEADARLPGPACDEIRFDVAVPTGASRPPDAAIDPAVPTLVVFTSGSTGSPKGVAHLIRPQGIAWFVEKFRVNEHDVFISLASMSQTGIADLMCLAAGATLQIVDIRRRGIADALQVMRTAGVTFLSFVPSALRMALAFPGIEHALASLRVLDLHGERILASDIALLRTKLPPGCRICVTYGATEVGGVFSWFVRDEAIAGEAVPIGYLCPDTAFALVDEAGAPVRAGEAGELLIRGPIAMGDWAGGRLVTDRFTPAEGEPGSSIYAMGDLVRMRPDGLAEFVGRHDRKVKVRGLWADLGEVEAALRGCEGVADAVAMLDEQQGEADGIAAFVVPLASEVPVAAPALRRAVAAATAEHMVPQRIELIRAIPRLPNYKPDLVRLRSALRGGSPA